MFIRLTQAVTRALELTIVACLAVMAIAGFWQCGAALRL